MICELGIVSNQQHVSDHEHAKLNKSVQVVKAASKTAYCTVMKLFWHEQNSCQKRNKLSVIEMYQLRPI